MSFTIASAHIDFRTTRACQLNAYMAGSAEAIEAKPRPFPFVMSESGQTQAPVTDAKNCRVAAKSPWFASLP